ncbi:unnamed protein product, partial [Didymodactylos carnosus]
WYSSLAESSLSQLVVVSSPSDDRWWDESEMTSCAMKNDKNEQHFSPHKDAQYAPNGDQRSFLSLLIYLTDDFENGETCLYFPKVALSNTDIKGLTIKEEINAYGGLETGYESITIKPKTGAAIAFTHNLLHEALPRERRLNDKPLGFAVMSEEHDYLACLNYFCEAQQWELNYVDDDENDDGANDGNL